jgi:hypothetical protein
MGRGVLVASGVIAGESLMGVTVGVLAYLKFESYDVAAMLGLDDVAQQIVTLVAILLVAGWMYSVGARRSEKEQGGATRGDD